MAGLGSSFFSVRYITFFYVLKKELYILFRSFLEFLATYGTQKNVYLWLVCGCWKGCGSRIKCLPVACKWLLKGMWWQNKMCTCGLYVAAERDVVAENTFAAAEKIFGFHSSWLRPAHDVHFKFVNFYICAFLHASICCQYNVSEFFLSTVQI